MAVPDLPDEPEILDIGCGPGRQTLQLAEQTGGRVSAVDLHPGSLRALERRARERGLADRIAPIRGSMAELCFGEGCFDLIWSEGAIYCMGFEAGLAAWKRYLRPGGCLAISELTWLTDHAPEPAREFWRQHYPAMKPTRENFVTIDRVGYQRIDSFPLPESDWWDHYYAGLAIEIERVTDEFDELGEGLAVIDQCNLEMEVLRKNPGTYSYVFYIARKPC